MKVWQSEYIFNNKWEKVVTAALRKYPNPITDVVVAMDVLNRRINDGEYNI
jgi:hypothetical protein